MNDLVPTTSHLPAALEDLAKFILIGQEKLVSLKAEIRAIDKAKLAEEVLEQKREESRRLADLILLASVRIGELTKQMPTARGKRSDIQLSNSGDTMFESPLKSASNSAVNSTPSTKKEAIRELGFSKMQVSRFETLASYPEEVEKARMIAAAESRPITQTEVLNLAKYKQEKTQAENQQIDEDCRLTQALTKALTLVELLPTDKDSIAAMRRGEGPVIDITRRSLRAAINNLLLIQREYEKR